MVFEILNALNHGENMNADLAIKCAMLQDCIEDTPFRYEDVNKLFGQSIANRVLALSKNNGIEDRLEKNA